MRSFYLQFAMFNDNIYRFGNESVARVKNQSRQIKASNAEIHGKRQNSRYPWIPWIRDLGLAVLIGYRKWH